VLVDCSSSVGQSLLSCGNGSQHESFLNSTSKFLKYGMQIEEINYEARGNRR